MELLFGIVFTVGVLFFIMNRSEKFAVKNRDQAEPRDNGELFGVALIIVFVLVAIFATQQ
jgi:hypothetical protein